MTTVVVQSAHMAVRDLRAFFRRPLYVVITLAQPVLWLLLFGKVFAPVADGAHPDSYVAYLTPGVAAVSALFSSGWSGMNFVVEMEQGTLSRLLVTPVRRGAVIAGRLLHEALAVLMQSTVVLAAALALGVRFSGGPAALAVFVVCVTLVAVMFAALSNTIGLLAGTQDSVIGGVNFLVVPMVFLSTAFIHRDEMPPWMHTVMLANPVNWLVEVGREALRPGPDWGMILVRAAALLVLALGGAWLSTLAFRAYQRWV